MRIINRPFDEEQKDFQKMWEFLICDYADKKGVFTWTIGRLGDWKYGCWNEQKCFPSFMRKNAQLWWNQQELAGFVISEDCSSSFTVFTKKEYAFLYPEMLHWVKTQWSNRAGELITQANEYQEDYIRLLEKEGFVRSEYEEIERKYCLSDKVKDTYHLDDEFVVEDMLQHSDLAGKAVLYNSAWKNNAPVTNYDLLRYEYNRESPCFHPRFDLSVVNKTGQHVASCVAFIDYQNGYAEVEKVCSHHDYRRKGLAEAVIRECFKRLYQEGIETAYIGGSSTEAKGLYGKLGCVKSWKIYEYVLPKNMK